MLFGSRLPVLFYVGLPVLFLCGLPVLFLARQILSKQFSITVLRRVEVMSSVWSR